MRLYQRKVALLVPEDSLLRITPAKNYYDKQYLSFFIQDRYSHLAICLHLMESHHLVFSEQSELMGAKQKA